MKNDLLLVLVLSALITIVSGLAVITPRAYYSLSTSPVKTQKYEEIEVAQSEQQILVEQQLSPQQQIANFTPQSKQVSNTSGSQPNIFLTYDDGSSKLTLKLLDVLDDYPDVKVTFFVNCKEEVAGTFQRILESGHGIANHTCTHPDMTDLSASQILGQLSALDSYVNARVQPDVDIEAYRPPYGATNNFVRYTAETAGYKEWTWSVDPRDWESPGVGVILNAMENMSDGDIIVLHDSNGKEQTVEATKQFLADYHDKRIFKSLPGAATYELPPSEPEVWNGSFKDDDSSIFEAEIEWIANRNITRGCNPPANDKFCPNANVTRAQMAAFLQRAIQLKPLQTNTFNDDNNSIFEASIEAIAARSITRGCNPPANDKFCPNANVTRAQMAAFLVRAFEIQASNGNMFKDDNGSIFEQDINKLATAGITHGCNPPANDKFCPDQAVTREQMAAFLQRALEKYGN